MPRFRVGLNFFAAFLLIALAAGPAVMIAVERRAIAWNLDTLEWVISLLYAVFFFCTGFGGVLVDYLIRWRGPRVTLLLGATGNICGAIGCYYATGLLLFLLSFILLGLSAAPFLTWLVGLSSTWLPRFPALSLAGVTVGSLVSFWPWEQAFLWAGAPTGDWRAGLLVLAAAGLVQAALVWMLSFSITATNDSQTPKPEAQLEVWPFAVNVFLVVCSSTILLLSLRPLELPGARIGPFGLFAAFSAAALIGRFLFAGLCDRGHRRASLVAGLALIALALATFRYAEISASAPLLFVGTFLFGCGYAGYVPVLIANVRFSCSGAAQRNSKAILVWGNLGIALGSFLSGRSAHSISLGIDIAIVICILAAICLWWGFRDSSATSK
jgi:MFS family permease